MPKGALKKVAVIHKIGDQPKKSSIRVPDDIPIHAKNAQRGAREGLCWVCLEKGLDRPATNKYNACSDPAHFRYMRRLTRWAQRVASAAVPVEV